MRSAIECFLKTIELNPEHKQAFANRGKAYQLTERYEEALNDFDRAIELDPEYAWAIVQRGHLCQFIGQFEKFLRDLNHTIELKPDNDWYPYLRSLTLTKLDRPAEAQTDLQSAIVLSQAKHAKNPIDWQNNFNLALYYLAAGRFDESNGLYGQASESSRDSIEDAIWDLDDYLVLFPDRLKAREVRDRLSALV